MKRLFLIFMCVALLSGCGTTIQLVDDAEEVLLRTAIASASKALGYHMAANGDFEWTETEESYIKFLKGNGVNLDTVAIVKAYLAGKVPELYHTEVYEAMNLIESGPATTQKEMFKRWESAIVGFRAGALFAQKQL